MQEELTLDRIGQLRDAPVLDQGGDQIGKVEEIFFDDETRQPEWIGIGTGFFGTKRVLVPLESADVRGDAVQVPYDKDKVKGSPDVDSDHISQETEQELYQYYGLRYSERRSGSGLPEGGTAGSEGSVTRHEEELAVGKQQVQTGSARLRKWVETEPVEMDVELRRETARVTREPVDQPVADAEIGEDAVEVPLSAERPVVQKQTVAKERVGLETDVETDRQTVEDEVRKERVDVEGDAR